MIFISIECPGNYESFGGKWYHQLPSVENQYIINGTRHGWDKLKNVDKYENRICPKFSFASPVSGFLLEGVEISSTS